VTAAASADLLKRPDRSNREFSSDCRRAPGRPATKAVLETERVLRSRHSLAKSEIIGAFSGLLAAAELQFEDQAVLERALFTWKDANVEFADWLIGARHRALGCSATASFDAKAAKLPGFVAA
jgi:predicted nucleic-acid-binding protein